MPVPHYRSDNTQYDVHSPKETTPAYHTYQATPTVHQRFKELLFFIHIVLFSLITVLAAYTYLSMNIPQFFAFLLAGTTGCIGLGLIKKQTRRFKK